MLYSTHLKLTIKIAVRGFFTHTLSHTHQNERNKKKDRIAKFMKTGGKKWKLFCWFILVYSFTLFTVRKLFNFFLPFFLKQTSTCSFLFLHSLCSEFYRIYGFTFYFLFVFFVYCQNTSIRLYFVLRTSQNFMGKFLKVLFSKSSIPKTRTTTTEKRNCDKKSWEYVLW